MMMLRRAAGNEKGVAKGRWRGVLMMLRLLRWWATMMLAAGKEKGLAKQGQD